MSRLHVPAWLLGICAALLVVAGLGLFVVALSEDGADAPLVAAVTSSVSASDVDDRPARWLPSDPEAVAMFERAQLAARDVTYDGVKVVAITGDEGTRSAVVTVSHSPAGGMVVKAGGGGEAKDAGAGADGRNEFARGETSWEDLTSDAVALRALKISYRLQRDGTAVVCDRAASVVAVRRIDGSTAARLWMDDDTGLLLRRELLDAAGKVVQSTSFISIEVGNAGLGMVAPDAATPWALVADYQIGDLRDEGWPVPESLRGGLILAQVRQGEVDAGRVVQVSYTDGLTSLSVFLQRGELDESALEGYTAAEVAGGQVWVREGSTPLIVWQSGSLVITATSDVSTVPLAAAVTALPAAPAPSDDLGDRLGRGVARVGSWFNPLS